MKKATVKPNQSLADMVLMTCGTMEAAMQVMAANAQSLTATATVGNTYNIPDDAAIDATTLAYLQQGNIVIGTKG